MAKIVYNYIDGEWRESESARTFETSNPANSAETVARYQQSTAKDARRAIDASASAADEWSQMPAPERGSILTEASRRLTNRKAQLTELLVREEGKTKTEASGEVQRAIDIFAYYGSKASDLGGEVRASSSHQTDLYTIREPMGVAALITPWNYPIAIPAWKLAPALATGNAVVFKPASLTPGVAAKLVETLDESGLPDGVCNFVTGPGSEVGSTFATHEDVDVVSFTGSTAVGNLVYDQATDDQKRVQLELGGKNPAVVSASADVERAADIVAAGAFGVTGQACTATSRAIVHEEVYDEFLKAIVDRTETIDVGPGLEGGEMGPQVSKGELESTLEYIDSALKEGAELVTGGNVPKSEVAEDGYFVEPTVFADVQSDMRIACEEVFGPVLAVIPVSDFDEGVEVANDTEYGLSASVITENLSEAHRFTHEVEAGVVKVNEKTTGLELHVPFGGMKGSSSETYREQGDAGLDAFSISKTVYVNY
ncbi:aldehyde dehydrogenase family protein [Halobacteria archaeon AArc-curdl1]|uniref:Aldehyde dehydrogenase family protein n=1 Tax=Natronosalvus hydrolyticus TaxID=2979988 RepID=A0AAP2Z9Q0_9EURY|nr:aldehyde dehydrogenase family protein [Halobacteria archaeon AArc-curdl1]